MDAFVKAAREAFKDENIGTKELFKLMENGQLLAKDILPLVGKYMSEAAKKGGALEKMLKGNQVAMNRLRQTWQNFQNNIFMGGFGEALTKTFNQLAAILKDNTGFAKTFGAALGAVMDQLMDKLTMLYDYVLIFWLEFKYYILDQIPEGIKNQIADWAAWAASMLIILKVGRLIYGVFKAIFGLGTLSKALGLSSASGWFSKIVAFIRSIAAGLASLGFPVIATGAAVVAGGVGAYNFANNPIPTEKYYNPQNTFSNMMSKPYGGYMTQPNTQQQKIQVEIATKDSEFGKAIDARIVDNNNNTINMISPPY